MDGTKYDSGESTGRPEHGDHDSMGTRDGAAGQPTPDAPDTRPGDGQASDVHGADARRAETERTETEDSRMFAEEAHAREAAAGKRRRPTARNG